MSESNRVESNSSRFETNRTFFGPVRFDRIEQPLGSTRFDSIGALENTIILKGMEDWIDWIKTIKVIADGLEI
jgi:hypothetical protein